MMEQKKSLSSRGVGFFLAVLVIILAALAMVLYSKNVINIYCSESNSKVYLCCGLAIAFAVLSLVMDLLPVSFAEELVKPARVISFLLLLYAVLQYVLTQIMLVGAIVAAIDVDQYGPLVPGFTSTMCCLLGSAVLALLAAGLARWCPWAKSGKKE